MATAKEISEAGTQHGDSGQRSARPITIIPEEFSQGWRTLQTLQRTPDLRPVTRKGQEHHFLQDNEAELRDQNAELRARIVEERARREGLEAQVHELLRRESERSAMAARLPLTTPLSVGATGSVPAPTPATTATGAEPLLRQAGDEHQDEHVGDKVAGALLKTLTRLAKAEERRHEPKTLLSV